MQAAARPHWQRPHFRIGLRAAVVVGTILLVGLLVAAIASGAPVGARTSGQADHPKGPQVTATTAGRAMWLWNWTDSASVVAFAQANGVNQIFAYAAPGFLDPSTIPPGWSVPELPLLTALVTDGRAAGISVEAMGGDPSWVTDPAVAVTWAHDVTISGLFDGAHLELEPWQLSDWTTDQVQLSDDLVKVVAEVKAALGPTPLEISIPSWLYEYSDSRGTPMDVALLQETTTVAIISFFDTVSDVDTNASHEVATATSLGVRYRIGVQVTAASPAWTSFAGATAAEFTTDLDSIDAAHADTPRYLGVAVEEYLGWAALS
jgi:hypothetical protein